MPGKYYQGVKKYFADKAKQYDLVDEQLYWRLSDSLLKKIVEQTIVRKVSKKKSLRILDAGAGTGRWSFILYHLLKKDGLRVRFDLVDITPEMLMEAEKKIKRANLGEIMNVKVGNIEKLGEMGPYDLAISFYNVLSFTEKPDVALKQIAGRVKEGGVYASIVANKYHSYYFNIIMNRIGELGVIEAMSKTRFTSNMPYIHCFSPESIRKMYLQAGFKKVEIIGFPNFIYPNIEDTAVTGQSEKNKNILRDKKSFNRIMALELRECFNPDVAARGNALLVVGTK